MFKSKKARCLTATALVAGSACVSGPQLKPPPPADCPPGYLETHKRFGIYLSQQTDMYVLPFSLEVRPRFMPVPPNPMNLKQVGPRAPWTMGTVPMDAVFVGQSFITNERIYGHFTELQLSSGERLPICMEIFQFGERGTPTASSLKGTGHLQPSEEESITPERPAIFRVIMLMAVDHFD